MRSVRWLDSAGLPASGRGGEPWPARDGSAATHLEGHPAVHARWTTSFLSYRTWCGKLSGKATTILRFSADQVASVPGPSLSSQVDCCFALVAQWIEHRFPKPGVAGPIPAEGTRWMGQPHPGGRIRRGARRCQRTCSASPRTSCCCTSSVILLPLAAVATIAVALSSRFRHRWGLVTVCATFVVTLFVPLTSQAGESLAERLPTNAMIARHADIGNQLVIWAAALGLSLFAVVAIEQPGDAPRPHPMSSRPPKAGRPGTCLSAGERPRPTGRRRRCRSRRSWRS